MEDLGVDEFDDFDSLPIKPRGKPVPSLKSPLNLEANSSPGYSDKSPIKGQITDLNDTTALLAAGMSFYNRFLKESLINCVATLEVCTAARRLVETGMVC